MSKQRVWHVVEADRTVTEETEQSLRGRIREGSVTPKTWLWSAGMADWEPAGRILGLFTPPAVSDSHLKDLISDDTLFPTVSDEPHLIGHESFSFASDPKSPTRRSKIAPLSYVSRHWRGDLSLPVSYWVNGFILTIIATIAEETLGAADITTAPRLISGSYAAFTLFFIVLGVWQLVGIWRSAGRVALERRKQRKSEFWAVLARIATALGFISLTINSLEYKFPYAWANIQIAFYGDDTPHHILKVLNGGTEIELAGGIDFGTAGDLQTLIDATPVVQTVDLDSLGGRIAEAEHARDIIREHHLSTYTDSICASACTIVYMAGYPRYLGPNGKLGSGLID